MHFFKFYVLVFPLCTWEKLGCFPTSEKGATLLLSTRGFCPVQDLPGNLGQGALIHLLFIWYTYNNAGLSHCHLRVPAQLLWGQGGKRLGKKTLKFQQKPRHDRFICWFVQFRTWRLGLAQALWRGIKPEVSEWPWQDQVPRGCPEVSSPLHQLQDL